MGIHGMLIDVIEKIICCQLSGAFFLESSGVHLFLYVRLGRPSLSGCFVQGANRGQHAHSVSASSVCRTFASSDNHP